ncbi:MAG: hypothetical protein ACYTGQ_05805, partial [Planctomycetota bacterium]
MTDAKRPVNFAILSAVSIHRIVVDKLPRQTDTCCGQEWMWEDSCGLAAGVRNLEEQIDLLTL